MLNAAGGLSLVVNDQGRICYATDTAAAVLAYPKDYLNGAPLSSLVSVAHAGGLQLDISRALSTGDPVRSCYQFMVGFLDARWYELVLQKMPDTHPPLVSVYGHDVTARHELASSLQAQAVIDPLTGVGNRVAMKNAVEQSILQLGQGGPSFAVALLDLDEFKKINDTLGHDAGDTILQEVARRVKESIGTDDVLVRLGGDEFGLLFKNVAGEAQGVVLAERVLRTFRQPFYAEGTPLRITTSLGLVLCDRPDVTKSTLLKRADLAMYQAKAQGKNQACLYCQTLERQLQVQVATEQSMFDALQKGEFYLEYQPIFNPSSKAVHSVEALMRWSRKGGDDGPGFFISIAEQNGLIHLLGQWALRSSCAQLVKWDSQGCGIPTVAVNVSPVQLAHPRFVENVKSAIRDTGVDPRRVVLEITEGALMEDPARAESVLKELQAYGLNFAVDDFGTGYSSLSYLHKFPLYSLKIDRSFITDMMANSQSKTIVCAVLSLARALNLRVVAEGVETQEQSDALAQEGCALAQGWVLSPAMPPEELAQKIQDGVFKTA